MVLFDNAASTSYFARHSAGLKKKPSAEQIRFGAGPVRPIEGEQWDGH